jgi:flagellar FliJ protein
VAFRFGLEAVFKHRQRLEEVAQRDLAEAQYAVNQCLKKIEDMYRRMDEVRDEILVLQRNGDVGALQQIRERETFLQGQNARIERERLEARRLMSLAEERHEILIGAARDRRILEKLKEKRRLQYQEWLRQLETKQLDDQTMTRTVWRKA